MILIQLIRPEEMCSPNVDELSMMTYLSQFPNARLKPGAPLRPRTNPNKVRAYGPGKDHTHTHAALARNRQMAQCWTPAILVSLTGPL